MRSRNPLDVGALGDRAIVAYFEQVISDEVHARVLALARSLESSPLPGQFSVVPSYSSVTVLFHDSFDSRGFAAARKDVLARAGAAATRAEEHAMPLTIEIPVRYGGDAGPDLADVASLHGLSEAEVIELHTKPVYKVYQLGFAPGFPYLAGLDERLRTPRLSTPRVKVAAGSVGIGDAQTGVYPLEGPGGWRIIGHTELKLFDPQRDPPALLRAGMRVKFVDARNRLE